MLFQKTIIKKYMGSLSEELTTIAWEKYSSYFLNEDIQANIHKIKEEQFQEGFLRELFVKVLGYTINPSSNYNLTTELKNEVGSKKADGAILIDNKPIGVIELKDHKTPDLTSIENQAFGYKSKHKDTKLVIISNFEKLRLYIDDAVEHREWDIFHMTYEDFRELCLCLAWTQVARGIALQMKQESVSSEDQITKALYKDYSQFKRTLFADIIEQNPAPDGKDEKEWQLLLFKKTQKLLDRLLFIFFVIVPIVSLFFPSGECAPAFEPVNIIPIPGKRHLADLAAVAIVSSCAIIITVSADLPAVAQRQLCVMSILDQNVSALHIGMIKRHEDESSWLKHRTIAPRIAIPFVRLKCCV